MAIIQAYNISNELSNELCLINATNAAGFWLLFSKSST